MKWREAARAAAPILTSILPPPFNLMATHAVKEALGISKNSSEDVIDSIVSSGDPKIIAKLKLAEIELLKQAQELGVDIEKIMAEDRKDARQMAVKTKSYTPAFLTWSALIMLAIELAFIAFNGGIPASLNNAFGGALLLAPLTLAQQGFNFFLGSSMGSAQKNDILSKR
ncbi:hypothetical protein N9W34_06290 [Rickettsiales bacterium]|nr:hypothetical protein [Rickettsiales bacterium]